MKLKQSLLGLIFICTGAFLANSCKKDDGINLDPIELDCDHFKTGQTLTDDPDRDVDYLITCVMDVEADIVVKAGVVIQFAENAGINVTETGSFNAVGTSDNRVRLEGSSSEKGFWKGILFNSNSPNNLLKHVVVNHAGGSSFNTNDDKAAVIIWADAQLDIQNCNIGNSANYGISAIYTNSNWSISSTRIQQCDKAPAVFLPPYLASFDGSNNFNGNPENYLLVDLGTEPVTSSLTWRKGTIPYRITSTFSLFKELTVENAILNIEPGTEIQFEDNTGLWIDETASLMAKGTASEPITFRGVNQTAGSWTAIYFDGNTTQSEISHATVSHAGQTLDYENSGILMRINPPLTLSNITFNDISGCSVFNKDVALNPNLTTSNLTHNNTAGSLCHE